MPYPVYSSPLILGSLGGSNPSSASYTLVNAPVAVIRSIALFDYSPGTDSSIYVQVKDPSGDPATVYFASPGVLTRAQSFYLDCHIPILVNWSIYLLVGGGEWTCYVGGYLFTS